MRQNNQLKKILCSNNEKILLDDIQCQVLLDKNNSVMIVAAAGSGKTTTMVAKVIYLIRYQKVDPDEILILSFTNEAVNELKSRLLKQGYFCGKVFTFHKLALEILYSCGKDVNEVVEGTIEFNNAVENLRNKDLLFKKYINKIKGSKKYSIFIKEFYEIFRYTKTNGILYEIVENQQLRYCLERVNQEYQNIMSKYNRCDFDDLIITAFLLLRDEEIPFQIRYILIDEFQDISRIRYYLVKMLRLKMNSNIIVVGDDWQSIYGFSGSDLNFFYQMLEKSSVHYLVNTYRNSQQLINIAGTFITSNKKHLSKTLKSDKSLDSPIQIYYYISFFKKLCLLHILKNIPEIDCKKQIIFLLGRYHHDGDFLNEVKGLIKVSENIFQYGKAELRFLTIHSAKGLTADQVIILNFECGEYGFPSQKRGDYFVKILPNYLNLCEEEERRLCYVALTRTKNYVYMMVPLFHASTFVKEIKRISNQ